MKTRIIATTLVILTFAFTGCGKNEKALTFKLTPISQTDSSERILASRASILGHMLTSWAYTDASEMKAKFEKYINQDVDKLNIVFDPPLSSITDGSETKKMLSNYTDQCLKQMENRSDLVRASFYLSVNVGLLTNNSFEAIKTNKNDDVSKNDRQKITEQINIIKQIITDMQMPANVTDGWSKIETRLTQIETNKDWVIIAGDLIIWHSDFEMELMEVPGELRLGGRAFDKDKNQRLESNAGAIYASTAGITLNYWLLTCAVDSQSENRTKREAILLDCAKKLDITLDPDPASIRDVQSGSKAVDEWAHKFTVSLGGSKFLLNSFLTGYGVSSFMINNTLLADKKPHGPYTLEDRDRMMNALAMIEVASENMGLPERERKEDLDRIAKNFSSAQDGQTLESVNKEMMKWFSKAISAATPPTTK